MSKDINQKENRLVALASIAAELYGVKSVAWGVSLAAKNAKVISAQAGDKGLGFQPITNFIDEISQQAMQGVNDINEAALKLSRIAVYEQRSYDAYRRFNSVKEKYKEATYINSMADAMKRVEDNMLTTHNEFRKSLRNLISLLQAMDESMLSARSIASVSRIVTSDAAEYRSQLEVVADNLEEAAVFIKEKVSDSYQHLNQVDINTHHA